MYSPLIDLALPPTTQKWSTRASLPIDGLNVHHWATTSMAGRDRLVYSSDPASANYLIYNNGDLVGSVPEEYRAWTTSGFANDDDKITVEIQNESTGGSWPISDAALNTLIRLYADIAKRYNFAASRDHIYGHRDYFATECPGDYVYSRLGAVAIEATALNNTNGGFLQMLNDDEQTELLTKVRQLHAGEYPKVDSNADGSEKVTLRTALKFIKADIVDLHDTFHGLQINMPWPSPDGTPTKFTFRSALGWIADKVKGL